MAPTNYTVASTDKLLGPKRSEAADVYYTRMKRVDEANRKSFHIRQQQQQEQQKQQQEGKTVRFQEHDRIIEEKGVGDDDDAARMQRNRDEVEESRGSMQVQAGRVPRVGGGESSGEDVTRGISDEESTLSSRSLTSGPSPVLRDAKRRGQIVEPTARIRELRSQEALSSTPSISSPRRLRRQESRIDTSVSSASSSSSRNGSTSRPIQVSKIYFSPVDVNSSLFEFTDPLISEPNSPEEEEEVLTPTQERYDDEQLRARPETPPAEIVEQKSKLMLKPEQVDRLVKALAECPLLHVHVTRQWWDDVSDAESVLSETDETPSLTTSSSSPSTLYSQPNQGFVTEQRTPSVTREILEEEFAREYPDHPKARQTTRAIRSDFGGIAIVDPKVHGAPIRFVSRDYQLGTNTVKVGQCSFLNIPYGTTVQSQLRIESASSRSVNCRVMMQVVNQVLERKTGQKAYLLVAELDVTESITKAALMELSSHAGMPLSDIELVAPGFKAMPKEEQIDWCALADELQTSCEITDLVEDAAISFAHLTAENCTMQTLTLMSELERLKVRHQDFLVLRATGHHDNGVMSGVHIPWTSQHLDQVLYESDPAHIRGEASKAARLLRHRVVTAVAEGCVGGKAFTGRIWWGDQMRRLHCVPLLEGADADGRPAAWVAFLSDLGRYEGALLQAYRLGHLC
ncbi:hypothetical protein LTR97_008209 [Elasticomyces elasticus]|uniref:Uncharacterized protein n=1 Tax=Elasticomyces elasticus TaxID=574655 RepID=A0AAN7W6U3_9PEZI|nr:hypothetical protein LTR97_008209 [Elasticomyces elasticus]